MLSFIRETNVSAMIHEGFIRLAEGIIVPSRHYHLSALSHIHDHFLGDGTDSSAGALDFRRGSSASSARGRGSEGISDGGFGYTGPGHTCPW